MVLHSWVTGSVDSNVLVFVDFVEDLIRLFCLALCGRFLYSLHRLDAFLIKFCLFIYQKKIKN